MKSQPYLILSKNAEIIEKSDFISAFSETYGIKSLDERLFSSLSSGDADEIRAFCERNYSDDGGNFVIYQLIDFCSFNYMFLEKNIVADKTVNIAFLGHDIFDFAELISPSTELYQTVVGKCIYELLCLKNDFSMSNLVTPELLLLSENLPEIKNEILYKNVNNQCCDLPTVIGKIIETMRSEEYYPPVEFSLEAFDMTDGKEKRKCSQQMNFKIPAATFVHLFMALTGIFSTLSLDHRIGVEITYYSCFLEIGFSSKINTPSSFSGIHSSLSSLGEIAEGCRNIADVASVIAYSSDIGASVSFDSECGTLKTVLNINYYAAMNVKFKYNDPYMNISSLVRRSVGYLRCISKKNAG